MVHDNRNLDKYVSLCGSKYAATIFLGKQARKLAEHYDNLITHAEALSWLLSGDAPRGVTHYKELAERKSQRYLQYVNKHLEGVLDRHVQDAVVESIKISMSNNHLVYVYGEVYNRNKQARVRVITNMIWYEMQDQGF